MSRPDETWTYEGASLGVWRDGPPLGQRRTAAIGAFECGDAEHGAAALREAAARLRADGFEAAIGPMDGNTWARYRFVVETDGRPPFLMEPGNPPYYPVAFEQAGFSTVGRYFSADRPAAMPASPTRPPDEIALRELRLDDFEHELRRIHALALEAFAHNAFYTPISFADFLASYSAARQFIEPSLVLLAEDADGALQGFLFGLPNLSEGDTPRAAILKTYASLRKGCGSMLANAFHERALAAGYERVIHALIHADNLSAAHSRKLGGVIFRHYALWGRVL